MKPLADSLLPIGRVLRSKGLKGEVHVRMFNRDSSLLLNLSEVRVGENSEQTVSFFLDHAFPEPKGFVAQFKGIEDVSQSRELTGKTIFAFRSQFPELSLGEHYCCDLEGCWVEDIQGKPLGVLKNVMKTCSNDVWVLDHEGVETLFPVIPGIVKQMNLSQQKIVVFPLEFVDAF